MDTQKLKIKIGDYEFEAEGASEVVQAQFVAFKELISSVPAATRTEEPTKQEQHSKQEFNNSGQLPLEKIVRVDGRIISLTGRTDSIADAIMVILLAQRIIRNNETVTSTEVVDGLKTSGHIVSRVDFVMQKLASQGYVLKIGQRRATQYRLTNQGTTRAQEIARQAVSLVA